MGVLVEWADRIRLFRLPLADSLQRAIHLPRAAHGMSLAHLGIAITAAGIAAQAWEVERIETLKPGDSLTVAAYTLRLDTITRVQGPNFTADDATITVLHNGAPDGALHPQRRFFPLQKQNTGETAIRSGVLSDLYVALGDADASGAWTVRAYWKPMVSWIWLGALIMAAGGVVSLSDRRWRVGVAARLRAAQARA
jgi:cytochrome c-type biogenesis protein CcmF